MSLNLPRLIIVASLLLTLVNSAVAQDENATWSQWRGNNRDATVNNPDWPEKLNLEPLWSVNAGPSYSGPVIVGDRVFITETVGSDEAAMAYSLKDGTKLWRTTWKDSIRVPFFAAKNGSWIRATSAADDTYLYVFGMKQRLLCLNQKDGKIVWQIDFLKDHNEANAAFGGVCSPLLKDGYVYIQAGKHFYKLHGKTGSVIWKASDNNPSLGMMSDGDFSSPVFTTMNGQAQFLVQNRTHLYGVNSDTGELLWSQQVPNFRGMNILTPIAYKNGIFTSTYRNGTYFYQLFRDEDTFVSRKVWDNKAKGYMTSPVLIGKHAYIHLSSARYSCIDLDNGQTKWTSPSGNTEYSSLITNGKLILSLVSNGKLNLIKANPEQYELLDSKQVADDSTWAHLAIANDKLFVRSLKELKVYRWK